MSFVPAQIFDKTAFGELSNAEPSPLVQIAAQYGIRENVEVLASGAGASVTAVDSNYVIESGTAATGVCSCAAVKQARYRPGQGLLARFTALFESAAANSEQLAGLVTPEDAFAFGFNGLEFGVLRAHGGVAELRALTVTVGAAAPGNATVTINGVAYVIALVAGTVGSTAYQIAKALTVADPLHKYSSNLAVVTCISVFAGAEVGAFTFAPGATGSAAAWAQTKAGIAAVKDWVPQASWSSPPSWAFDPTKGNVYQIKMQYLGYGGIRFYIENPETQEIELVHIYRYANANLIPSVSNPTFKLGWQVQNGGNTNNLIVRGASAAAFVEGKVIQDERARSYSVSYTTLNTTQVCLLNLRNRIVFDNKYNREDILPRLLVASTDHNPGVVLVLSANTTVAGDLIFNYIDNVDSIAEVATDVRNIVSIGREIVAIRFRQGTTITLDLFKFFDSLFPGEVLTVSAYTNSGAGAEIDFSLVWQEDL